MDNKKLKGVMVGVAVLLFGALGMLATGLNPFADREKAGAPQVSTAPEATPPAAGTPQVPQTAEPGATDSANQAALAPADNNAASSPVTAVAPTNDGSVSGTAPAAPGTETKPADPAAVSAPVFSVLRVEPDGSVVVAGTAAPNSTVELMAGTRNLGVVKAGANGDFAIVLDEPLKPGDYQLVLRATEPSGTVATSPETAVVAVPETPGGQVLALVERPGEPSRLITKPEPAAATAQPGTQVQAAANTAAATSVEPSTAKATDANSSDSATLAPAAATAEPAAQPVETAAATPSADSGKQDKPGPATSAAKVLVEAVEIEGRDVFVAGIAEPGTRVRVYANDTLLGEALASAEGRFLIEATRDLPVGDYIIRADQLDTTGATVQARAQVPFQREAGEKIAAVAPQAAPAAPSTPAKPADSSATAAAPAKPAAPSSDAPQAAPLQSAEGSVIIRKGDTLWQLSRRVYGRGVRYSTIYLANQAQISDPNRIWPGQVFKVPGKAEDGVEADLTKIDRSGQ